MATTDAPDEEILKRMIEGDEAAFTTLYRRRQAGIYRFAVRMSGSEAVAEDVTQETFLALVDNAASFDPAKGSLSGYLYGIARNRLLRRLEREGAYVPLEDCVETGAAGPPASPEENPLGRLARAETVERVRAAVLGLPRHYREVIVLCELEELSYADAAEVLGCALGTVRSRLARGRALLGERLRMWNRANAPPVKAKRCFA
jgi:RNA polymerase sigma-70 factor (ECF subfamily)